MKNLFVLSLGLVVAVAVSGVAAAEETSLKSGPQTGDSLGAFVALFAETREPFTFVIVGFVAALSLAWIGLARWITGHTAVQQLLQRWGRYLLPFILIAIGAYILADTKTDTLEVVAAGQVAAIGQPSLP